MAAVFTGIVTFIYLLARTCCVQGQTPTGMLHDYTYIPFVQCSATFTTELALSVSMQVVVNNVSLVSLSITETKITCSVYNNFSLCANHTSDSSKIFTVKTFFPSELPRNANQFECSVTGLYTNSQTYNNKYFVNVTFESTTSTMTFTNPSTLSSSSEITTSSTTQAATIQETPTNLLILQSSSDTVSKNVFVSTVSVLSVLLAILTVIIIVLLVRTSRAGHSAKATENESDRNSAYLEPLASIAATSSAVLDDTSSPSESSSTATYDKLGSNLYESLRK